MSRDTLSDLLRSVRGAVFYYVSCRDQWSAETSPAREIAAAVLPGCEHVMECHMIAKGSGWAAVEGQPPIRLGAGDSVEELAHEVGLSRSALHQRFMHYLGQPPMQCLASWRIQLGARLLRESNRTVAAIALDTGYDSEAAFAHAFKRAMGAPPGAWRKAQAARNE